jgi:hypothetical protein
LFAARAATDPIRSLTDMKNYDDDSDGLGSLSQSARRTSLKSAQMILIIVGLLGTAIQGFMFSQAEKEVDSVYNAELRKIGGIQNLDPDVRAEVENERAADVRRVKLLYGGFVLAFVTMIILGICVYMAPVICTVLGLIMYLAAWFVPVVLLFLADEPKDAGKALVGGIIIKILIIIGMVKAIQAAIAYQAESRG